MTEADAPDAVRASLLRIVPDADLDAIDVDEDVRDALELDSLDFLGFVEGLTQRTGVRIDEEDYPRLRTLRGAVAFLETTPPTRPTGS
jgi:acyl carrier protein